MKSFIKIALASAFLGASLSSAFAQSSIAIGTQTLLAGWDFNNIGTSTIGSTNARYSDVFGDTLANPFTAAAGTLFVNGQQGSDAWSTVTRTGSGDIDRNITGRAPSAGLGSLSGAEGSLTFGSTFVAGTKDEFAVQVHTFDTVNTFKDVKFDFWAKNGVGSSPVTVNWFFSTDGGATKTNSLLSSSVSGSVFTNYSVDLSAFTALTGQADVSLIGLVSGVVVGTNTLQLDNFAVYGVAAIPEPSTYAAILSALTMGVVALRRRKATAAV